MAAERSADDIQRDIEQARAELAVAVDRLADKASPKRVAGDFKQQLIARAKSPQGQAVIGATGVVVVLLVVRRIRKR